MLRGRRAHGPADARSGDRVFAPPRVSCGGSHGANIGVILGVLDEERNCKEPVMFCPQCGTGQSADLKFCKSCGVNLSAVRQAVTTRDTAQQFDWSKTWVAEILMSREEQERRKREREGGLYAEYLRSKEIKAGVITSFVGIGVMIFLFVLMQGIILSGQNPPSDNAILSRIWVAGMIPFFVGLGLLVNGMFVSKRLIEIAKRELQGAD